MAVSAAWMVARMKKMSLCLKNQLQKTTVIVEWTEAATGGVL